MISLCFRRKPQKKAHFFDCRAPILKGREMTGENSANAGRLAPAFQEKLRQRGRAALSGPVIQALEQDKFERMRGMRGGSGAGCRACRKAQAAAPPPALPETGRRALRRLGGAPPALAILEGEVRPLVGLRRRRLPGREP